MKFTSLQYLLLSVYNHLNSRTTRHDVSYIHQTQLMLKNKSNLIQCHQTSSDCSLFVANKGRTANFMLYWPSITTFTLVNGWNDNATESLIHAVNRVVEKNVVLTGTASRHGIINNVEIRITPGTYTPVAHNFVNVISIEKDLHVPDFKHMKKSKILDFMDTFISPLVPKTDSVIESISNQSPLFGVDLIILGNGYACYVVKMSHCVGDGVTYFNVIDEINHFFNQNSRKMRIESIDWTNEKISHHEIFPERFSSRDTQIMYGIPFLLGLLKNTWNIHKQKKGYFLLCKKKVQMKKKFYLESHQTNVSANDIITTALCEASLSTTIFAFTMNMRRPHCNYGGNYHNEIPFPKSSVLYSTDQADPGLFRNILRNGWYYDTNEIPPCPFVLGTVGRISSLATIQKLIATENMEVLCHAMLSSFVSNVPLDTAFISSMNNETYVVLHNFRDIKYGGLLEEISYHE